MARGRKPIPAAEEIGAINDQVAADLQATDQLAAVLAAVEEHQGVILAQYGDGLPYNRLRYLDKCRYHMARSAEDALEVGRCLIVMKECEGHGEWLPLLEQIGIGHRTAQVMMQTTLRFSNAQTSAHLVAAAQSKSKLLELMILDDEELADLNSGESVRGLQLDDVERMSVSDLRRALRQTRADKEAEVAKVKAGVSAVLATKDKVIAAKSARIAALVEEKNKAECQTDDERHGDLERQLANDTLLAVGSLLPIRQSVYRIRSLDNCPQGLYVAMQNALDRVIAEAMGIAADFGIQLNLAAAVEEFNDDPNAGEDFSGADADFGAGA